MCISLHISRIISNPPNSTESQLGVIIVTMFSRRTLRFGELSRVLTAHTLSGEL